MAKNIPQIEESWQLALQSEFASSYFSELRTFLKDEIQQKTIYPQGSRIFAAFNFTPLPAVRVVILGQDPYHGKGQAHGLCFSVPEG
ncbi:MAG: uracil-DNA glycosylase, partial [Bacteroidales bacterium]|nr:uracil-DNA glycosylase [Bacteroidales bacterium]